MAATNVQAFSGDVTIPGDVTITGETILGTATYRKKRTWNRNGQAYVYLGNIQTLSTTGIRLDINIVNANSGYQSYSLQINLQGDDTNHGGGKLMFTAVGLANSSTLRNVEIGYVYASPSSGIYEYQLWLKDPTTDVAAPMSAYLNCQGFYNFNTGISDVAQGGSAPTNFQLGVPTVVCDNIGNVGIGTSTPGAKLEVFQNTLGTTAGDSANILKFGGDSGGPGALLLTSERVSNGSTWTTTGLRLQKIVDSTKMGYIQFGDNGSLTGGLIFGNSDATERMRILPDGKVGIGTNGPNMQLDCYVGDTAYGGIQVRSSSGAYAKLIANAATGGHNSIVKAGDLGIVFTTDNSSTSHEAGKGFYIAPWANNTSGLRIDENGNVGIGTNTPGTTLDVNGHVRIRTRLYMASGDNFGHSYKEVKAGGGNLTFTVPMRAWCNWTPAIVKLKASRCYGSGGGHESWRWDYGFRYLNCSGSNGQRIISNNLVGGNPNTSYLVESFGASTNYYTFTFIMNGRNNMVAEVEMIAFGGIYL